MKSSRSEASPVQKLAAWVPRDLAEDYQSRMAMRGWEEQMEKERPGVLATLEASRIYVKILGRLITDLRMKAVWTSLQRDAQLVAGFEKQLAGTVIHAALDFESMPLRSRAEQRSFFLDVAKKAKTLALRISESSYDFPSDMFIRVSAYSHWAAFERELKQVAVARDSSSRSPHS